MSSALDSADKSTVEATIIGGTKLCSRRLPQDIIYCVGGVSVFFPLFTQFCDVVSCHTSVIDDKLAAEVIELVASVLDGNVSNQQQMYLLSGLSILGFLLQAATPQLLNMKTLPAMKYMFDVLRNCGILSLSLSHVLSVVFLSVYDIRSCTLLKNNLCIFRYVKGSAERCYFTSLFESRNMVICKL